MTDRGYLHRRAENFGKTPPALLHNTAITDGAVRLYAHMHWRYGSNMDNHESRRSMADILDVSQSTITSRVNELAAHDWLIVIERHDRRGRTTNFYHVFEDQDDCRAWREAHPSPRMLPRPQITERKTRKGVGGKPSHKPKSPEVVPTQVNAPVDQLKLTNPVNSSSRHSIDSYDLDSTNSSSQASPSGEISLIHWRQVEGRITPDSKYLYIGRKHESHPDSIWHNPYKLDDPLVKRDGDRLEVVGKYLVRVLQPTLDLLSKLDTLKGKTLVCWCTPALCHGHVLKALANLSAERREYYQKSASLGGAQLLTLLRAEAGADFQAAHDKALQEHIAAAKPRPTLMRTKWYVVGPATIENQACDTKAKALTLHTALAQAEPHLFAQPMVVGGKAHHALTGADLDSPDFAGHTLRGDGKPPLDALGQAIGSGLLGLKTLTVMEPSLPYINTLRRIVLDLEGIAGQPGEDQARLIAHEFTTQGDTFLTWYARETPGAHKPTAKDALARNYGRYVQYKRDGRPRTAAPGNNTPNLEPTDKKGVVRLAYGR